MRSVQLATHFEGMTLPVSSKDVQKHSRSWRYAYLRPPIRSCLRIVPNSMSWGKKTIKLRKHSEVTVELYPGHPNQRTWLFHQPQPHFAPPFVNPLNVKWEVLLLKLVTHCPSAGRSWPLSFQTFKFRLLLIESESQRLCVNVWPNVPPLTKRSAPRKAGPTGIVLQPLLCSTSSKNCRVVENSLSQPARQPNCCAKRPTSRQDPL